MKFYVIVDSNERIPLFSWNVINFNSTEELHLATGDLLKAKALFEHIKNIKIVDENNREQATYLGYDSYMNIVYNGSRWSEQMQSFSDELIVKLQKTNITDEVARIAEKVDEVVDIDSMSTEDYREYLLKSFNELGRQTIFNGTQVTLLDGSVRTFTYNLEDQSNLLNALFIIQTLGDTTIVLPYHSHGMPCTLYNALDILKVYFTLQFFSTKIQTQVNMLCAWVREVKTKEELLQINFNSELPEKYKNMVNEIMGPTYELAMTVAQKYFPEASMGESNE